MSLKSPKPPSVSAYRFHVVDSMPWKRDIDFSFEQGRGNNTDDLLWKWTAMWYQIPPLSVPATSNAAVPNGSTPLAPETRSSGVSDWLKITFAILAGIGIGVFTGMRKIRRKRS